MNKSYDKLMYLFSSQCNVIRNQKTETLTTKRHFLTITHIKIRICLRPRPIKYETILNKNLPISGNIPIKLCQTSRPENMLARRSLEPAESVFLNVIFCRLPGPDLSSQLDITGRKVKFPSRG